MKTYAKDVMSTELLCIREGTTIGEALKMLMDHRITGMPVVDKEGKMVGVVSEYDIIAQLSPHLTSKNDMKSELFRAPVKFSRKVKSVKESTSLSTVVKSFVNKNYRRLPVVNEHGVLVGMITRRDLMRVFYYRAKLS